LTVIAIDGPAGAGKTTVARAVAAALGFKHVDTGGMYRAVALLSLERGVDPSDGSALEEICRQVDIWAVDGEVAIDGRDVSELVRRPDVTQIVSVVAAHPEVRSQMTRSQRSMAQSVDVVMEGRDIGSVVFPHADLKIFLTASLEERSRRRSAESGVDPAEVQRLILQRDSADEGRDASPLSVAQGAIEVDSTGRSIDDVVAEIQRSLEDIR
jgi:cytidylate kinase